LPFVGLALGRAAGWARLDAPAEGLGEAALEPVAAEGPAAIRGRAQAVEEFRVERRSEQRPVLALALGGRRTEAAIEVVLADRRRGPDPSCPKRGLAPFSLLAIGASVRTPVIVAARS